MVSQPVFPPSFPAKPKSSNQPPPLSRPQQNSSEPAKTAPRTISGATPSLEAIVQTAFEKGYSDVHLGIGEQPRYRARGEMLTTNWPVTSTDVFRGWLQEILTPQQIDGFFGRRNLMDPMPSHSSGFAST